MKKMFFISMFVLLVMSIAAMAQAGWVTTRLTANSASENINNINAAGQSVWSGSGGSDGGSDTEIFYLDGTTVVQLTINGAEDIDPKISAGGQAVWRGWDGLDYEIFYYNGTTVVQLTENSVDDRTPQINAVGHVVWHDQGGSDGGSDYEIFYYDGSTVSQLTINSEHEKYPQINDIGHVVWHGTGGSDGGYDDEIFYYDGSTTVQLTTNAWKSDLNPQITNGGHVLWERSPGGYYYYDGSTTVQLTTDSYLECGPYISAGGQVVWCDRRGSDGGSDDEIFYYDGISVKQLTTNAVDDEDPKISAGGQVVWHIEDSSDYNDDEILYYDGAVVMQLTNNSVDDRSYQISAGGQVVWYAEDDSDDNEIFHYDGNFIVQVTNNSIDDHYPQITADGQVYWLARGGSDGGTDYEVFRADFNDTCTDYDGDGYYAEAGCGSLVDCSDTYSDINPGAAEVCTDGVDNNCDGKTDAEDAMSCPVGECLRVVPLALNFGSTEELMELEITNACSNKIIWAVSGDVAWLTLAPLGGNTTSETDRIIVNCDRTGLAGGTYTADITIVSDRGDHVVAVMMTVDEVPEETAADFDGCTGLDGPGYVQFYDTSVGDIVAWEWIFGDGAVSYEQNPLHAFSMEGVYTVSLTVTASNGEKAAVIKEECVRVSDCFMEAGFIASPKRIKAGETVRFTSQVDGPAAEYAWDFGDGGTSDEEHPEYRYVNSGTYSVTLTVTGTGCSDTQTKSNLIMVDAIPVCPVVVSLGNMPRAAEHAGALRDFRDHLLLTNLTGKLLTGLYYASAKDVNAVIDQDDELKTEIGSLVTGLAPRVKAVADGNPTAITQAELDRIKDVLATLADNGGAVMKMTVQFVLNKIEKEAFLQQYGMFLVPDDNN